MKSKQKLYKFRRKIFPCEEHTIRYLNYALALNNSNERYEVYEKNTIVKKGKD